MTNSQDLIVNDRGSAREALERINSLGIPNVAIFVINGNGQLIGSLTDGDIRRGLLKGLTINAPVLDFINPNSKSLLEGSTDFDQISEHKDFGIRFMPVISSDRKIQRILDLDKIRALIPVDAVLMAGGKGERLKPLTNSIPKPMLEIGDQPIILRNINRLCQYGVSNFHIAVRHMAEQIIEGVNTKAPENTSINFVREDKPLGTVGALSLIEGLENDTVLLMNSDLLTNIDFNDFYRRFVATDADMMVATVPYHIDVPYAVMEINGSDEVIAFSEKPRYTYYSNAGIYLFKKKLIELIPSNEAFDATHLMEAVIQHKLKLGSYPILGYWLDIGRLEDFYKAQEDVKHVSF